MEVVNWWIPLYLRLWLLQPEMQYVIHPTKHALSFSLNGSICTFHDADSPHHPDNFCSRQLSFQRDFFGGKPLHFYLFCWKYRCGLMNNSSSGLENRTGMDVKTPFVHSCTNCRHSAAWPTLMEVGDVIEWNSFSLQFVQHRQCPMYLVTLVCVHVCLLVCACCERLVDWTAIGPF